MAKPTHLPVFFVRSVRVRREHIAGETVPEGRENLMKIINRGESLRVKYEYASDMIVAGTCIEENGVENKKKIEDEKRLIHQEQEDLRNRADAERRNKKAA